MNELTRMRIGSLFSGIGGLELGGACLKTGMMVLHGDLCAPGLQQQRDEAMRCYDE